MRNFNRSNRSGGGRNFGKRDFSASRPRQMHDAICDNCGKPCQVPFQPTGEKPVYCRDCFAKMNGGSPRSEGQSFSQAPQAATKEDVRMLNEKLDKILTLLGKSSEEKSS